MPVCSQAKPLHLSSICSCLLVVPHLLADPSCCLAASCSHVAVFLFGNCSCCEFSLQGFARHEAYLHVHARALRILRCCFSVSMSSCMSLAWSKSTHMFASASAFSLPSVLNIALSFIRLLLFTCDVRFYIPCNSLSCPIHVLCNSFEPRTNSPHLHLDVCLTCCVPLLCPSLHYTQVLCESCEW